MSFPSHSGARESANPECRSNQIPRSRLDSGSGSLRRPGMTEKATGRKMEIRFRRGMCGVAGFLIGFLSTLALAASFDLDKVAGVYKRTFANANIDGGKYQSED